MPTGDEWTPDEVAAVVADYFDMLATEIRGESFNKAEHNRNLRTSHVFRSRGAVELKHQNISAVLIEMNCPSIDGYKPLGNYQDLLREIVIDLWERDCAGVRTASDELTQRPVESRPPVSRAEIWVQPPQPSRDFTVRQPSGRRAPARIRDYVAIEARNGLLGKAGEEFVLELETRRLFDAERRDLAKRVVHVSASEGDGAGYDIGSFETDGRRRLIEVKTTRFGLRTPFYVSPNEVRVSDELSSEYQLYRLFNFQKSPKAYALFGSLQANCTLQPAQYLARPKN